MSATAIMKRPMATKRNDKVVKIDAEVIRLAGIVAAYRDMHMNEYLSDLLLPIVKADLAKEQAKHGTGDQPKKK